MDDIPVYRFGHKAMNTHFEIMTLHTNSLYASQAAHEAFCLLDRIENALSRFIPNSDISRINQNRNRPVLCSEDSLRCLESSVKMEIVTNGYFNIRLGNYSDVEKRCCYSAPVSDDLDLDHEHFSVTLRNTQSVLDLGGIGKGYAVDRMAELLQDWGIKSALIHGGRSSVLVFGSEDGPHWPVSVTDPFHGNELFMIQLVNRSLSASGLEKGFHIINPKTMRPAEPDQSSWAMAGTAAESDALSTAFMVMDFKEIEACCIKEPAYGCLKLLKEGSKTKPHFFGNFSL
jgi:thiamine biosynthesis lipoprotein